MLNPVGSKFGSAILIFLSIEPDAIKLPVGSNLAVKISPSCPESSITGAKRPLVRGAYRNTIISRLRFVDQWQRTWREKQQSKGIETYCLYQGIAAIRRAGPSEGAA